MTSRSKDAVQLRVEAEFVLDMDDGVLAEHHVERTIEKRQRTSLLDDLEGQARLQTSLLGARPRELQQA